MYSYATVRTFAAKSEVVFTLAGLAPTCPEVINSHTHAPPLFRPLHRGLFAAYHCDTISVHLVL